MDEESSINQNNPSTQETDEDLPPPPPPRQNDGKDESQQIIQRTRNSNELNLPVSYRPMRGSEEIYWKVTEEEDVGDRPPTKFWAKLSIRTNREICYVHLKLDEQNYYCCPTCHVFGSRNRIKEHCELYIDKIQKKWHSVTK